MPRIEVIPARQMCHNHGRDDFHRQRALSMFESAHEEHDRVMWWNLNLVGMHCMSFPSSSPAELPGSL